MTQFDDPGQKEPPSAAQEEPPESSKGVQVYERQARVFPPALLFLFVILGLALLWFLFAYVF
jgi:hypothetical protein